MKPARATEESLQRIRDNVPKVLLAESRWVAWDGTLRKEGRLSKAPLNPNDPGYAKTNKPDTWGTFDAAVDLALHDTRVGGLGLVLTDSDYWALDLDHVIDTETGELAPAVSVFLAQLGPAYTERSPSGDGLHVIFCGHRPGAFRRTKIKDAFGKGMDLEVFGGKSPRYLTMTGEVWQGSELLPASDAALKAIASLLQQQPAKRDLVIEPCADLDFEARRVWRALANVPSDDYDTWIKVGMALRAELPDSQGFDLWLEWSSKSNRFDPDECDYKWRSFQSPDGGVGLGTIYWLADQHDPAWRDAVRMEEAVRGFEAPSVGSVSSSPGEAAESATDNKGTCVSSVGSPPGPLPEFRPFQHLPPALLPVPPFDSALLPKPLRRWVEDIANRIQCPIDFPAVAVMVVTAALVGRRVGVRPKERDDWLVIPNLWGGVVGRPGVMKTPGLQEPLNVMKVFEAEAKGTFDKEARHYAALARIAKVQDKETDKAIKESLKKKQDLGEIAADLAAAQQPEPPIRRRYLTNDATVEKLGELLNENPNGILMFRDELTGFLRSLDKEGQEGSRAFYLEAWNGNGSFTFDRIGRGTVEIEAAITSVLGGIQPGPLTTYLRSAMDSGAGDDGLLQRFQLLVYPDVSKIWKNVDDWPDTQARDRAIAALRDIVDFDAAARGATVDDDDAVPYFRFSPEGQLVFNEWREKLELRIRKGDQHAAIEAHLSKYRSLVPSLALLIHVVEGGCGDIQGSCMTRAVESSVYLEAHARRIYGLAIGSQHEARAIAERIQKGDLEDGFDARSVYRAGWTHLNDKGSVAAGLEILIQRGWLAPQTVPTGGRPATVYRINPGLQEMLGNDKEGADHDPRATPEHAQETAEGGGQATDRTDRRSSEAEDDRPSTAKRGPQGTDRTDESTDGDSDEPTQENSDG